LNPERFSNLKTQSKMKKVKSILTLALAFGFVASVAFTSCGGKKDKSEDKTEHPEGEHPADSTEHPADSTEHPADSTGN
jgi:hypothetical protein